MKLRRSATLFGALLVLASCTSDPKEEASAETTVAESAETTAASSSEAVVDLGPASAKVASVLTALDARPEEVSKDGSLAGTGPCPLIDVSGATVNDTAGSWFAEVKPPAVSCGLAEGKVGVVLGDIFPAALAEVKKDYSAPREFPAVSFANGSINSICTEFDCSAVWTDGSVSVFRSAAERDVALDWLKGNLATVLNGAATVDPATVQFVANDQGAGLSTLASKDMADVFRAQLSGDYETYWSFLYPEQQAEIKKDVFIKCMTQPLVTPTPTVTAIGEYDQQADLGVDDKNAKVVTLEIRDAKGGVNRSVYTLFAEGRWRWLLGQPELKNYAAGKCK
jgi:hypothetical protein